MSTQPAGRPMCDEKINVASQTHFRGRNLHRAFENASRSVAATAEATLVVFPCVLYYEVMPLDGSKG